MSAVELLGVALTLSFLIAATAMLFDAGERQQRLARTYSQVQIDLRDALREATWGIRHGYSVINPSDAANFADKGSHPTQVIVRVPEPSFKTDPNTGLPDSYEEVRYYLANGTLWAQRADESGTGTALLRQVRSLTFHYFQSVGMTRVAIDATPQQATEVQITLTAVRGPSVTTVQTLVNLRNFVANL